MWNQDHLLVLNFLELMMKQAKEKIQGEAPSAAMVSGHLQWSRDFAYSGSFHFA